MELSHYRNLYSKFLYWFANNSHLNYGTLLFFKDLFANFGSIILGFLLGIILTAFIIKDAQWYPDKNVEGIHIIKIRKNNRSKMFVIVPTSLYPRMSTITVVVIFLKMVIMRFLPIKNLSLIDSWTLRIVSSIFIMSILLFCVFILSIDFHIILPSGLGKFAIYDLF